MNEKKVTLISNADPLVRCDHALLDLFSEHEELENLSRSQLQKWIESGRILVNGAPLRAKDKIPLGSKVEITIPSLQPLEALPENIPLQILYEDEYLAVINKQPNLTVHPSETQTQGTLVNALLFHIKNLSGIGGVLRPGIVHRIDKNTSGALVVSKTDKAHWGLSEQFSKHTIQRTYWAFTYGALKEAHASVHTRIGRSENDRKKMAVYPLDHVDSGREAITYFKEKERFALPHKNAYASWVEATLHTGRTHQVRVHLHHLGHSILGDPTYGTPDSQSSKWKALPKSVQNSVRQLSGQALHARVLGFLHPITQKEMYFEAEPFEAIKSLISTLKNT